MNFRIIHNLLRPFQRGSLVLMYHRITEPGYDPWDLAVSPENFEQQLQILTRLKKVVQLDELVDRFQKSDSREHTIALSFDDGYVDNYSVARPLLEQYNIPATFFITTGMIGKAREYWWDELERVIVQNKDIPKSSTFTVNEKTFAYPGQEQQNLDGLYMELWGWLLPMNDQSQQVALQALRNWKGIGEEPRSNYRCMNEGQLKELSRNKLFSLQVHTITHPALAHHAEDILEREMTGSKQWLEQLSGQEASIVAYPYGNYNELTMRVAARHFKAAFTTEPKVIGNKSRSHSLGRFQVKNWPAEEFERQLHSWIKTVPHNS